MIGAAILCEGRAVRSDDAYQKRVAIKVLHPEVSAAFGTERRDVAREQSMCARTIVDGQTVVVDNRAGAGGIMMGWLSDRLGGRRPRREASYTSRWLRCVTGELIRERPVAPWKASARSGGTIFASSAARTSARSGRTGR